MQSVNVTPYSLNLLTHNSTQPFSCRTVDKVGNPSAWTNISLRSDFVLPSSQIFVTEVGNYVFADSLIKITCIDENALNTSEINIRLQSGSIISSIISTNLYYNFSYFSSYDNQDQNLSLSHACTDSYGNVGPVNLSSHRYLGTLGNLDWNVQSIFSVGVVNYLGNDSRIDIDPEYRIGEISIEAKSNGTTIWWSNQSASGVVSLNKTNWTNMFANIQSNSHITIRVHHYVTGTTIGSSTSLGIFQRIAAPNLIELTKSVLSNGTSTQGTLTQTPCNSVMINITIGQIQTTQNVNRYT